jgi:hypothetical protein
MDGAGHAEAYDLGRRHADAPDGLIRIIHYGTALQAMSEHVDKRLISGPPGPMLDLLDHAYDRFATAPGAMRTEEFTLFVMSLMLSLCDDPDEERRLRIGAARYMVTVASRLPEKYTPIIDGARRLLRDETRRQRQAALPADVARQTPRGRAVVDRPAPARAEAAKPEDSPLASAVAIIALALFLGFASLLYLVYATEDAAPPASAGAADALR